MTSLLASTSLPVLALVLTNAGGEGKSTFSEMLAALARLAGMSTIVADVDPGNRGYLNRNGDKSALPLNWSVSAADGSAAIWFDANLANHQLAILDTGANMMAATNPINEFIGTIIQIARQRGYRIVIFGVTSPNKSGSDELIEMMYERFRRGAEMVVVQNNRDGSNAFASSLAQLGTPIINLPHLAPGLQAVRLRRPLPLDTVIQQPEADYKRATALIAECLRLVAGQQPVLDIVGPNPALLLAELASGAPKQIFYGISALSFADDRMIDANEDLAVAWTAFRRADPDHGTTFRAACVALHAASQRWGTQGS